MFDLEVKRVIEETPDSRTLEFSVPAELSAQFSYQAGQFVTIEMTVDGDTVQRCYSLSSCPEVDKSFAITVKEVSGGKLSPLLVKHIASGNILKVSIPSGRFVLKDGREHVFFAAGSGITPVYSMIKSAIANGGVANLIYSNRDEDHIIFEKQLAETENLQVDHVLSRPTSAWSGRTGRLNEDTLKSLDESLWGKDKHFYICGPQDYMSLVESFLMQRGIDKGRIHCECFNIAPVEMPKKLEDALIVGDGEIEVNDTQMISVLLHGEKKQIEVRRDETILDASVRADLAVPYSCMEGVCFACMARLDSGKVSMPTDVALDEQEVQQDRKILTCQSRVLNKDVMVDFDEA